MASVVIDHLRSSQASFEQRIAIQPQLEQTKGVNEHRLLLEQLQSLHVEQGKVLRDRNLAKEEIEQSIRFLVQQQSWLHQRMETVADKLDWQQSWFDNPMSGEVTATTTRIAEPSIHVVKNPPNTLGTYS